ncbi:MAG: putative glycosyltransferase [Bacteroidetes bacterium]|jgi:glycosyltransferase involved in cell wall biosynthesis|nr:putative glycosyltransferase [Bacteroidota bacterium]
MEEQSPRPLISIIIPVYNIEDYLRKCLISIIEQTYRNLEIIIINDGSTDNTPIICDEFATHDNRIKVIHQKNNGLSYSRNVGLDNAHGVYIGFVDGDDWIEKDMYETLYNLIIQYKADISICTHFSEFSDTTEIDSNNDGIIQELNRDEAIICLLQDTKIRNYLWEKLSKRELFNDIRFPTGKIFEDMAVQHKVFHNAQKVVLSSIPKYHYRIRRGSVTNVPFNPIFEVQYLQSLHNQFQFSIEKKVIRQIPFRPLKEALHIINHTILLPKSSINKECINELLHIAHQYDRLTRKEIGIVNALRRYFIFNHFERYASVIIFYRKIFPRKEKRY